MNSKIKKAIKEQLQNQKDKQKGFCPNCNKNTTYEINFKKEKVMCIGCKSETPIPDSIYEDYYKEFKKIGIIIS